MVFTEEKGTLRACAFSVQNSAPLTERRVKYIANRAAKNISSELSQTMVPTLTRFGLLTAPCACPVSVAVAVATTDIMSVPYSVFTPGVSLRSVRCVRYAQLGSSGVSGSGPGVAMSVF
ncbi:hypothetical protein GCM10010430_01150 [Kitasatospora cystarginea]|uniref:Uncharacterized protein n=1 Tax=Kitasatospora cystarginea TaxID=58350 RepID=A0ABP5Q892_9ACTN